jgi:hypothetical protein
MKPDIDRSSKYNNWSKANAIVGSILITGLGQIINRQYIKGLILLGATILSAFEGMWLIWLGIGIVSIVDTVCIANRIERGELVGDWQWF